MKEFPKTLAEAIDYFTREYCVRKVRRLRRRGIKGDEYQGTIFSRNVSIRKWFVLLWARFERLKVSRRSLAKALRLKVSTVQTMLGALAAAGIK